MIIKRLNAGKIGSSIRDRIRNYLYPDFKDSISIKSVVSAYLTPEDGIRTLIARAPNKWTVAPGLYNVRRGIQDGGSGGYACEVHSMNLGSLYSSSSWTNISSTREDTTNSVGGGTASAKFAAEWGASGGIFNIRQAAIQQYTYASGGSKVTNPVISQVCSIVALDSGGFDKPDGTTLTIEWTTDLTS